MKAIALSLGLTMLAVGGGWSGGAGREQERFCQTAWEPVTSLQQIPARLRTFLPIRVGSDNRISDRGGPFNGTDVVDGRPQRRFVLGGRSGDRWFVCFEQGGRGHHLVLMVYDTTPNETRVALIARGHAGQEDDLLGWQVDVDELKTALADGHLSPEVPGQSSVKLGPGHASPGVGLPPFPSPRPTEIRNVAGRPDLPPIVSGEELLSVYGSYRERIEAKAEETGVSLAWEDPPEVTRRTLPQYPQSAFVRKTEGTVLAMFVIDDSGRVSEVEILESHEGLDEAAEACIKTWEFRPARKDGQPVGTLAIDKVVFRIF